MNKINVLNQYKGICSDVIKIITTKLNKSFKLYLWTCEGLERQSNLVDLVDQTTKQVFGLACGMFHILVTFIFVNDKEGFKIVEKRH